MVAGAVGLVLLVLRYGEGLSAPAPGLAGRTITGPGAGTESVVLHLLIALTVVVVVGRLLGRLFRSVGQPPVIGEVVGGVLLGPSLLGIIAPDVYNFLLPPSIVSPLGIFAQLGVVLYMFLVGLDLNSDLLRGQLHATVAISHASILLPFVLGATLALYLYPRVSTSDVAFSSFALFLGIAMSITAFPVLARIVSDLGMSRSPLGVLALTCAAVDDVTAWCLLALVVGVAQAAAGRALVVTALTLAFIGVMFTIVRPLVARLASQGNAEPTFGDFAVIFASLLVASTVTEVIGVHAIFGAFLFGAVIPHDSPLARRLTGVLERPVTILLLPAFFAFAGMRTEIGLLAGWSAWLTCTLIVVVATVGKVGGTLMAGLATGLSWREAVGLGVLMNTRGLMQLIVLNVGLDLGVISPTLFAMMVLMALATTLATTPVLRRVL
jgi:Kef-type K+ transport system membrane component KefB